MTKPQPHNFDGWVRHRNDEATKQTRRPQVTHAAQIMGPGIAPFAVEIKDWSGAETEFNGFFYTRPGAFNSPDGAKWWIGHSIAQAEGFGIQEVWDYRGTSSPPTKKTRKFTFSGSVRVFSAWA